MRFICDRHREQLGQHPSLALYRWEEWLHMGQAAMEKKHWPEAIRLFGCCYELCEMTLRLQADDHKNTGLSRWDRLMLSGHLLAETLGRSGMRDLERHYLIAVHHHLTRYVTEAGRIPRGLEKNIEISLLMLKRHCDLYGECPGFRACLREGDRLLGRRPQRLH